MGDRPAALRPCHRGQEEGNTGSTGRPKRSTTIPCVRRSAERLTGALIGAYAEHEPRLVVLVRPP